MNHHMLGNNASSDGSELDARFLPTATQYKNLHEWLNFGFQFEQAFSDIRDILTTVSALELLGFFVNMVFFLGGGEYQLWFGIMNMFHVIRGFTGFILNTIFPASHDIMSKLDYTRNWNTQLKFAEFPDDLAKKMKNLLLEYYNDYELPAKVYSATSVLTLLIDIISTWVYIGKIGLSDKETAQTVFLGQLFSVFFYFILDLYLFLWIVHFRFQLSESMQTYLPFALVGDGRAMRAAFSGQESEEKLSGARKQSNKSGSEKKNVFI